MFGPARWPVVLLPLLSCLVRSSLEMGPIPWRWNCRLFSTCELPRRSLQYRFALIDVLAGSLPAGRPGCLWQIYCLLERARGKGTNHVITGFAYTSAALKGPFNLEIRRRTRLVLFSSQTPSLSLIFIYSRTSQPIGNFDYIEFLSL